MLIIVLFHSNFSQAYQNNPNIRFKQFDAPLSNNQAAYIHQDSYGFMWIATYIGLHKFDGEGYEIYHHTNDSSSLSHVRVESILETSDKRLWVGTASGLCEYSRDNNNFIRYDLTNPLALGKDQGIYSLLEDKNKTLWVLNVGHGLFYKNAGSDEFEQFGQELFLDTRLSRFTFENDSIMWVGTFDQGLYRLNINTKALTQYHHDPEDNMSIAMDYISCLVMDNNGDLWISSDYSGIDRLKKGSATFEHYELKNNSVVNLMLDRQNRLWGCVENGGILLYNREDNLFMNYENDPLNPYSPPSTTYWHAFQDKEDRIWFGSLLDGLTVIDENLFKFGHYSKSENSSEGLSSNSICHFFEDEKENLWIATDGGGLNYFDRKNNTFHQFKHDPDNPNSLSKNAVLFIFENDDEKLWLCTWDGGINIFDPKTERFERFRPEDPRLARTFSILKTKSGDLWFSTFKQGLVHYNPSTEIIRHYKSMPNDSTSIGNDVMLFGHEDKNGDLWFASGGSGITRLKKENITKGIFHRYNNEKNKLGRKAGGDVHHILEDYNGDLWFATIDGIRKYNHNTDDFSIYKTEDGLISNYTYGLIEDNNHFLWISTDLGLSKFDPKTNSFTNFSSDNGLQPGRFSRFCAYKTRKGELAFGGVSGFNLFDPSKIVKNPHIPEVYIIGIKLFNKEVKVNDGSNILTKELIMLPEITLNHTQSVFTLNFIALSYTYSKKNQYAYKLTGLEQEWNYVENKKSATYTNLSPGTYTFHVKAANNDGVWNHTGASLTIHILPPWWRSWWGYTLYFIGLILFIYASVRIRTNYLSKQRIELKKLVNLRTKELKEGHERIAVQAEELHTYNDKLSELNENLEKTVEHRTHELMKKNKKLAEFAFINAHNLRVPVANILGVMQLMEKERSHEELLEFLEILQGQSFNLDKVLHDIQKMLDQDKEINDL
ncbi:MAG: hypothetical protein OCD76_10335 [Reichenbachiella sp.]